MSLPFECINIVIQAKSIESVCEGGFDAWVGDAQKDYGYTWDEHLYRTGAMDDMSASLIISELEGMGFQGLVTRGSRREWADFCVFGEPEGLRGCDWLTLDTENGLMSHRDDQSGVA